MNTVLDPAALERGRTLNGAMDGLVDLADRLVKPAFREALTKPETPKVTRYRPLKPNAPAIWHERRPGRIDPADNAHEITEVYLAITLALYHRNGELEGQDLERAIDAAQAIYRTELKKKGALNWVHSARLTNLEPPTPTVINDVPLLTSALVVRVRLFAPNR